MSEEDYFDRTEPPTLKRLADIRKKGIVAKSRDMTIATVLLCTTLIFYFSYGAVYSELRDLTLGIWSHLNTDYADVNIVSFLAMDGFIQLGKISALPLLGIIFTAVLANLLQTGPIFSLYPLRPTWKNINIFNVQNYRKYFSLQTLVRTAFALVKIVLVCYATWKIIEMEMPVILNLHHAEAFIVLNYLFEKTSALGLILSGIYFSLSIFDLAYQKWHFLQEIKMSPYEVKEEIKQAEGNRPWKKKTQEQRFHWFENRIQVMVPKASFILSASPSYAVAFNYDPKTMLAPICVAMGLNKKAEVIKEMGAKHRVPIVEDGQLTRELFKEIKEGAFVPSRFFYPIAKILAKKNEES